MWNKYEIYVKCIEMYEPQYINIKAKFIKFKYLQLFIIKYINKVDIIIKPKLSTLNNNKK